MIRSKCFAFLFCAAVSACKSAPVDHASGGAGSASGATSGGGATGATNPFSKICGGTVCARFSRCCTTDKSCGVVTSDEIFLELCQSDESRGGIKGPNSCPPSRNYCNYDICQSFPGCTQKNGACGYWIESFMIVGGVEVRVVNTRLGCVDPTDMVEE